MRDESQEADWWFFNWYHQKQIQDLGEEGHRALQIKFHDQFQRYFPKFIVSKICSNKSGTTLGSVPDHCKHSSTGLMIHCCSNENIILDQP
jgi:hypothetical protein